MTGEQCEIKYDHVLGIFEVWDTQDDGEEQYNPFTDEPLEEESYSDEERELKERENEIKRIGIKEKWWYCPKKNLRQYLNHRVGKPTSYASEWLKQLRTENTCFDCFGKGKTIVEPQVTRYPVYEDCKTCSDGDEWIIDLYRPKVSCPNCNSAATKYGKVGGKDGMQRYICTDKKCRRQFTLESTLKKEVKKEEVINKFCNNSSCFQIEKQLGVPRQTAHVWIEKWLERLPTKN